MWRDAIEKRYFWAKLDREVEKILFELIKAEEEEDAGIYLLLMHYDHAQGEPTFTAAEKREILHLLSILIGDSRKHQKLLREMIERLEGKAKNESRS